MSEYDVFKLIHLFITLCIKTFILNLKYKSLCVAFYIIKSSFNPNFRVWDNVSVNKIYSSNTLSKKSSKQGKSNKPTFYKDRVTIIKSVRLYSTNKDLILYNNLTIHYSFSSILSNKTIGGKMLTDLILHLHKENVYNIPLFLSPLGIKASHDLIKMLNILAKKQKISKFKGDNILLDFISNNLKPLIRYNMKLVNNTFIPFPGGRSPRDRPEGTSEFYNIPILHQKVKDADCSGVYVFVHTSGKIGLGSALSCRDRLQDHLNSFYGHRPSTFLHKWVLDNGGIKSVNWAPLITYDNVVQKWYSHNFDSPLSKGGSNILQGFGQYISRLLEQCIYSYNKPFLSMYSGDRDIIFFNFSFKPEDMSLDLNHIHVYQAWKDKKMTKLLAESNSLNSLADILGLTVGTIRNNMNWAKGLKIPTKDTGKKTTVYLVEKGSSIRTEALSSQLGPKALYPKVELIGRSLYDLIPGRIHAIDIKTLKDFGNYANQRELWINLNPNGLDVFSLKTLAKQRMFLDNKISRYINVAKPGGVSTELGNFYFCRHPDFLSGMSKSASGFFAVNMNTGVAEYFENNSQPLDNRLTVRNHRNNNTVSKRGFRYINKDVFILHFPNAISELGSTYNLSQGQLENLPLNNTLL